MKYKMKTYTKTLYENSYSCYPQWGSGDGNHPAANSPIHSYVELKLHFDFEQGLRFSCSVPNFACSHRNPFKAILRVLEHESIGMGKYQRLKDRVHQVGCWGKL